VKHAHTLSSLKATPPLPTHTHTPVMQKVFWRKGGF
jgi:hypothetical protein